MLPRKNQPTPSANRAAAARALFASARSYATKQTQARVDSARAGIALLRVFLDFAEKRVEGYAQSTADALAPSVEPEPTHHVRRGVLGLAGVAIVAGLTLAATNEKLRERLVELAAKLPVTVEGYPSDPDETD